MNLDLKLVFLFVEILLCVYCFFYGWQILILKKVDLSPTDRFGLWLLRIISGPKAEATKRKEASSPQRMRGAGITLLFGGVCILFIIINNIFNWW